MQIEFSTTADMIQVRLSGRFDYTTRNQFMAEADVWLGQAPGGEVRLDMSALDYIDSSALGMLLMLRDKAKKVGKNVVLANAAGHVRQVLETAQFERLFSVV